MSRGRLIFPAVIAAAAIAGGLLWPAPGGGLLALGGCLWALAEALPLWPQRPPGAVDADADPEPRTGRQPRPSLRLLDHGQQRQLELSQMEVERELQRSVFKVAAELAGCREEGEALRRYRAALGCYWRFRDLQLLIWEKGVWRRFGDPQASPVEAAPGLVGALRLPSRADPRLILDLSPAVDGQAVLVASEVTPQPILPRQADFDPTYLLDILRGQLALSLRRVLLHQELQRLGRTDPLTGLARRWYGERRLQESLAAPGRVALALIDIDHFKKVNDTYGHASGDLVLAALGKCITASIRSADLAYRYGGEEFCLILPRTDAAGSRRAAERVRAAVAGLSGLPSPITVSIGLASARRDDDAASLLARCDAALYQAKQSGRDRIADADAQTPDEQLRPPAALAEADLRQELDGATTSI